MGRWCVIAIFQRNRKCKRFGLRHLADQHLFQLDLGHVPHIEEAQVGAVVRHGKGENMVQGIQIRDVRALPFIGQGPGGGHDPVIRIHGLRDGQGRAHGGPEVQNGVRGHGGGEGRR